MADCTGDCTSYKDEHRNGRTIEESKPKKNFWFPRKVIISFRVDISQILGNFAESRFIDRSIVCLNYGYLRGTRMRQFSLIVFEKIIIL